MTISVFNMKCQCSIVRCMNILSAINTWNYSGCIVQLQEIKANALLLRMLLPQAIGITKPCRFWCPTIVQVAFINNSLLTWVGASSQTKI